MTDAEPDHLGDGAYASITGGDLILTANHHDPRQASDCIVMETWVVKALIQYIARSNPAFIKAVLPHS